MGTKWQLAETDVNFEINEESRSQRVKTDAIFW